jgi:FdhE protein
MSEVGGPKSGPKFVVKSGTVLGEVAKPPFAVLPDPLPLFEARSRRLAALAPGHGLEPYLRFLAEVAHAQHDVAAAAADLPPAVLPPATRIAQALEHGLPPVSRELFDPDAAALAAIERLLVRLSLVDVPLQAAAAMTSTAVGWPKAHNARFCTCPLCATMWNVVRVKCVPCGSTDGISFREIEGSASVKAETCEKCRGYVKVLYQVNDPALDPMADDVATLGLDMLLAKEGWKRGGYNPFLLGC